MIIFVNDTTSNTFYESGMLGDGFFSKIIKIYSSDLNVEIKEAAFFEKPIENRLKEAMSGKDKLIKLIETHNPDIVVIFGTEYRKLIQKLLTGYNIIWAPSAQYIYNASGSVYIDYLHRISSYVKKENSKETTVKKETSFKFNYGSLFS